MNKLSRRSLIAGAAAATSVAGLASAARLAARYGLVPPDSGGLYGPGKVLTYASHRLLIGDGAAREFARNQISTRPVANGSAPEGGEYERLRAGRFRDWRLTVDGLVSRPLSLSLADLRSLPQRSQITQLTCEEGWSFIAEWTGVPVRHVLETAGLLPQARFVVDFSVQPDWIDSIDLADALHPQTLLTYGMNGRDLPLDHGGPLRLRVPRQLGYKSLKYVNRLLVTDNLKEFPPQGGYAWYAGV